ncbi:hypothetical protein PYCC9005_002104 [Savitreella phatthalungensis]
MLRPTPLLSRLLALRELSPLVLIRDDCHQSGLPLLELYSHAARKSKATVIWLGWHANDDIQTIDGFADKTPESILEELRTKVDRTTGTVLLIIRDLTTLVASSADVLPQILGALIGLAPGRISVIGLFHYDVLLPNWPSHLPPPAALLTHLATTVLTPSSFPQVQARLDAGLRARADPRELELESSDVLTTLNRNSPKIHIACEHRRKSGRSLVDECLLSDGQITKFAKVSTHASPSVEIDMPFDLSLNDRERHARDNVSLPHFAARHDDTSKDYLYYEPDSGDDMDDEEPDEDMY